MAVQAAKNKDPRWISETFLEKHGLSVREDAVPVGIEYWKGIDQGNNYEGELKSSITLPNCWIPKYSLNSCRVIVKRISPML